MKIDPPLEETIIMLEVSKVETVEMLHLRLFSLEIFPSMLLKIP
jgi:hypothetical protein